MRKTYQLLLGLALLSFLLSGPVIASAVEAMDEDSMAVAVDTDGNLTIEDGTTAARTSYTDTYSSSDSYEAPEIYTSPDDTYRYLNDTPGDQTVLRRIFDLESPLNSFEIGADTMFYSYKEPQFMKNKGYLYGIFANYTHRIKENPLTPTLREIFDPNSGVNMFRVDGRFSYGTVDYQSEGTGSESGISDYTAEVRVLAGWDINLSERNRLTPFAGFGFRYLLDDGGGGVTDTGYWGYDRESYYGYLPVGIEYTTRSRNNWSLGVTLEYDIFIDGTQKSHLEDGDAGFSTLKNDQNHGYGMRGSFRVTKHTDNVDFFVEPFARYWHISDSDCAELTYAGAAVGYGLEPENRTAEYGFRLGLAY